ncbi:MAG: alkaline phosphatase D family protein [Deltaproteobacteria bacterium]|nr:alkaline phosphatase D family protein [Deltaproteobacteria bacterium]
MRGDDLGCQHARSNRPTNRVALFFVLIAFTLGCVDSFDLGVGAFEIDQEGAILWTHVTTTDPKVSRVGVFVEVATDADFTDVVRFRSAITKDVVDFTVRAKIRGLEPATRYYYRFSALRGLHSGFLHSRVGSFTTAPLPSSSEPVRFVISGDSNLGYTSREGFDFHVLSAAAAESPTPDFFVYFGDTIYADSGVLPSGDAQTLDEYREVHRLTRADPHLQNLLAATGTFTGWDDHEVRNDYDGETVDPAQFEAGARAFFEYLPVRSHPGSAPFRTDRSIRWGRDVELFFLDGRQFRSQEFFCNPDPIEDGPESEFSLFSPFQEDEAIVFALDPALAPLTDPILKPSDPDCVADLLAAPGRTILGAEQLARLKQALVDSDATFKIIINNTPIATLFVTPYDRWDGYLVEQQELLSFIAANLDPTRTLVLTTDFHTNMAIQRPELTEVIVGPIGQTTFRTSVTALLPPPLDALPDLALALFDTIVDVANGGLPPLQSAVLGVEHDAFGYAVIDVFEVAGETRLQLTARGNRNYAAGANDPADVEDLFTLVMP